VLSIPAPPPHLPPRLQDWSPSLPSSRFRIPHLKPPENTFHRLFSQAQKRRKRIRSGRRRQKKKNTEAGEEEGKADQNIECEGYGETNQRRKREKKKTLQSAARVEKEIPVRARHWRDASAMDIRKGGRRRRR